MTPTENDIAEQNIERLLGAAYKPETPDPVFAQTVTEYLCSVGKELAEKQSSKSGSDAHRYRALRRRLGWGMAAAACVAICGLVIYAHNRPGKRIVQDVPEKIQVEPHVKVHQGEDVGGLIPRSRPATPQTKSVAVGERLTTKAGERRRLTLADGSILYLNQNTEVTQVGSRKLELAKGEIYLEVTPLTTDQSPITFVVKTPAREVAALGTHFAVRANEAGTGVLVTQGKVQINDKVIHTGQQIEPGESTIQPAPRASHLLDWTKPLMTAADAPLVPGSKHAGGALLAIDPNGQEIQLSLRKYHIDVHIEDGFARTTIDQTYFNNEWSRLEGTFYFPLPADATLSRLAMYVEENGQCRLMEGGMAEREHARTVFETIMHTRRDPALLEWVDGTTFKMRVFPLEGRKEKRIILSYTQRLSDLYGSTRYRFPGGSNMAVVRDWSFQATIHGGAKLNLAAEPDMSTTKVGQNAVLTVQAKDIKPDRDVSIEIRQSTGVRERGSARFSEFTHEKARYLMMRYRPELAGKAQRQRRDWVILFESSANRDPLLARAQIDLVRYLLLNAEHDDTFVLLTANTRVRSFDKESRPATPKNIDEAVKFLENTHLVGALDLDNALRAAKPFLESVENPHLVHLGAGTASLGENRDEVLIESIPKGTRYIGLGVGKRWNRNFMKLAAERTAGYYRQVNPDESLAWHGFDLLATLNTPRLLDVRVADKAGKASFLGESTMLSQGEEICAITRLDQGASLPKQITITGRFEGKPYSRTLNVRKTAGDAGYLPRAWAKLELDRLQADGAEKNKQRIIELSKASYVMSPFTSLLVLETDADYERFKVDRGRKDHWAMYPCPDRIPIVYEPGNQVVQQPAAVDKDGKKPVAEVLQTILVRVQPQVLRDPLEPYSFGSHCLTAGHLYSGAYGLVDVPDEATVFLGGLRTYTASLAANLKYRKQELDRWRRLAEVGAISRREMERLILQREANNSQLAAAAITIENLTKALQVRSENLLEDLMDQRNLALRDRFNNNHLSLWFDDYSNLVGRLGGDAGKTLPPINLSIPLGTESMGQGAAIDFWRSQPFDWVNYYKNHGYQINEGFGAFTYTSRIQFAPVFVSPTMHWQIGNEWTKAIQSQGRFRLWPELGNMDRKSSLDHFVEIWGHLPAKSSELGWIAALRQRQVPPSKEFILGSDWDETEFAERDFKRTIYRRQSHPQSLLYHRPTFTGDVNLFSDLTIYAPGLNTTTADIQTVLEAEAKLTPVVRGTFDPAARALIDKARSAGWQAVTIPEKPSLGARALTIHANGSGQYVFERVLWSGLREIVVCDGKTLLHLYPEIGLGSKRPVSRYHRAELAGLVPWSLPPVEDLARGANVQAIAANIVALIPASGGVDPRRADRPDRRDQPGGSQKERPQEKVDNALHVHLVFGDNGRLRERRIVLMPSKKTIYREVYRPGGNVTWFDSQDQQIAELKLTARPSAAPDLKPDTAKLVLVPMPVRIHQAYASKISNWNGNYSEVDADLAIGMIVSNMWHQNWAGAQQVFQQRFEALGDRRLGFYSLLANGGYRPSPKQIKGVDAKEPIFKYLATLPQPFQQILRRDLGTIGPKTGFIQRLASFHDLWAFFNSDQANPVPFVQPAADGKLNPEDKVRLQRWQKLQTMRADAFEFLQDCPAPFAFALLATMEDRAGNDRAYQQKLSEQFARLAEEPGLAYAARYEQARCFLNGESKGSGHEFFEKLYVDVRKEGGLPIIDSAFVHAFGPTNGYPKLVGQTSSELIKKKRFAAVLTLAWQNQQLGQHELANDLVSSVLAKASGWQKPAITLAAIDFLVQSNRLAQADSALQGLMADEKLAEQPGLWRLGAELAEKRGITSRAVQCLEKALDMEYRQLPEVINLQKVRQDYTKLLSHYHQLAVALTALENEPPKNFVARVVRAADRWRALDGDGAQACQLAAKTLQAVGARDLAWDYLTTPIALKPNESAPWLEVARTAMESDVDLADRAFGLAFKAESTNAQILWDHAQCLHQFGRFTQAQQLYRQLAESEWQPRFQNLRDQARFKLQQQ
jgi:hypothetical protein